MAGEEWFYVVAYDIPDDRRRMRVAKILEDYGDRVQYSVFELVLDGPKRLCDLRRRLARVLDAEQDSVRIYYLCTGCRSRTSIVGLGAVSDSPSGYVV